ncbi:MAG: general secretion pathway protein GspB [Halioglobus sp.]
MSLILDALNRSRQDANGMPGLGTNHPLEPVRADRRQYMPWLALSAAVVIIAWLLLERFSAPPAPTDIGAPVAELSRNIDSAVASVTTELKARAAESAQSTPVVAAAEPAATPPSSGTPAPGAGAVPAPAEAMQPAAANPPEVSEPAAVAPTPAEAPAVSPRPAAQRAAVEQLYQHRDQLDQQQEPVARSRTKQQAATAARTEQPVDVEKILQQAREEVANASLAENATPFLSSLSQQTKDGVPTLYYQRHDYSANPAESSVVLNGATVKVGGSPVPGMRVEEILPDSVVLSYQGTRFRLRALNSWINL